MRTVKTQRRDLQLLALQLSLPELVLFPQSPVFVAKAVVVDLQSLQELQRKAPAMICLAMEDSQLPLVRSATDAHDACMVKS
jgi:hypothetical protein